MLQLLAVNQYLLGITVVVFVIASVAMVLIVLVQRPQGGGLSDAFGAGAGGGGTAFGAKTGDALTTGTIGVFIIFLALAISLNYMIRPGVAQPRQAAITSPPAGDTTPDNMPVPEIISEDGSEVEFTRIDNPFESVPEQLQQNNDATATPEATTPVETPVETPENPQ